MTDCDTDVSSVVKVDDVTLLGAWHYLCVQVLLQAINKVAEASNLWAIKSDANVKYGIDKETLRQREIARQWINGGTGQITFEECCDAMGVDPGRARKKIEAYCHRRRRVRLPEHRG